MTAYLANTLMLSRKSILLLACMLGLGERLDATTYFVAPSGDDARLGTREEPLRTISAAADKAVAGDTVLVLEGVYRERVTPPRGGSEGKPIIYRGEPGKRVIVKGS